MKRTASSAVIARLLSVVCASLVIALLAHPLRAQGEDAVWRLLAGPVDPRPAWGHRAIHDPVRQRMVVVDLQDPSGLWVLSLPTAGTPRWQRIAIHGAVPPIRVHASAVYDSLRDRVIVFGGSPSALQSCNDVWSLSLGGDPAWSRLLPAGESPAPRDGHVAILDPVRDRMIVYGGCWRDSSRNLADAWALDLAGGGTWVQLSPVGAGPGPRSGGTAVYDPFGDRLIYFGGDCTTWTLTLSGTCAWDSLSVTSSRPPARLDHVAVVDPVQRRMVIHGGTAADHWGATLQDAWALSLDGPPAWLPLSTTGASPSVMGQAGIYSPERGSLIEFGAESPAALATVCSELALGTLAWSRVLVPAPDTFPSRRMRSVTMMDEAAGRMLAYSGVPGYISDLWAFDPDGDPATWRLLVPTGPVPDWSSFWSYFDFWRFVRDTKRNRLLAIHGDAYWGRTMNRIFALPLDGSGGWTELTHDGVEPLGRWYSSLIYDPLRDRVLMFGGVVWGVRSNDSGDAVDDLWQLSLGDTLRWTRLIPQGTPGRRDSHSAVYDARRDRMVVFAGETQTGASLGSTQRPLHDTWALSLARDSLVWSQLASEGPTAGPAVLDSLHDRLVAWPGDSTLWVLPFNGPGGWQRLVTTGDVPSSRTGSSLTFDAAHDRLLVFGGMLTESGTGFSEVYAADVYELRFADPPSILAQSARAEWDRATLTWSGAGVGAALSVLRTEDDGSWVARESMPADESRQVIVFTDRDVVPGRRYGYSLAHPGSQLRYAETWVTIPAGPGFALRGLRPNPGSGSSTLVFSLPDAGPATLELFDVAGRRIWSRAVGTLGPGEHAVPIGDAGRLRAGLYLVRLVQGRRSAMARVAIVH